MWGDGALGALDECMTNAQIESDNYSLGTAKLQTRYEGFPEYEAFLEFAILVVVFDRVKHCLN